MSAENPLTAAQDGPRKDLHEILAVLDRLDKKLDADAGETRELKEKLTTALAEVSDKLIKSTQRRGEFNIEAGDPDLEGPSQKVLTELITRPAANDEIRQLHKVNDDLLILSKICYQQPIESFNYYRRAVRELPILRKTLDTASSPGGLGAWVPTLFSATLHEQVRLNLLVAALHERVDMPQDPYTLPVEGPDGVAYIVAQQGDANAFLDAAKQICPSFSVSNASPGTVTLTSTKVGGRMVFSEEANEDVIIPVLPYLNRKMGLLMANAQEEGILNGDTTGTHMDSDVTATIDRRKAYNGYRRVAIGASAAVTISNTASDVTRVALADLRTVRSRMGKYGVSGVDRLVMIVGPATYIKLLGIDGGTPTGNISPVMTLDKYGPSATVLTGELAKVDGIPVIVSAFQREDLNTTGVYTGGTVDRGIITLVNRNGFLWGDRRRASLQSERIMATDQTALYILQRLTLSTWYGTDPVVGFVFNIKK